MRKRRRKGEGDSWGGRGGGRGVGSGVGRGGEWGGARWWWWCGRGGGKRRRGEYWAVLSVQQAFEKFLSFDSFNAANVLYLPLTLVFTVPKSVIRIYPVVMNTK